MNKKKPHRPIGTYLNPDHSGYYCEDLFAKSFRFSGKELIIVMEGGTKFKFKFKDKKKNKRIKNQTKKEFTFLCGHCGSRFARESDEGGILGIPCINCKEGTAYLVVKADECVKHKER